MTEALPKLRRVFPLPDPPRGLAPVTSTRGWWLVDLPGLSGLLVVASEALDRPGRYSYWRLMPSMDAAPDTGRFLERHGLRRIMFERRRDALEAVALGLAIAAES